MTVMSHSRPPTPPTNVSVEILPKRTSSLDSNISSRSTSSRSSSSSGRTRLPTNTLIITPLPLAFFEPKILDALKLHFASFSRTYIHRRSPYSPVSALGPSALSDRQVSADDESGEEEEEDDGPVGDLYSWVPLKSFRRAIVVYYSAEEAEAARLASDRLFIPQTPRCPSVTLRAFRAPNTVLLGEQQFPASSQPGYGNNNGEEGAWYEGGFNPGLWDEGEIRESPFHLRPPVTERNFLISPPGSPPVGWVAIREEPPNDVTLADDLKIALERVQRSRAFVEEGEDVVFDNGEDDVLLIPESAAGVSVRVENWSARRRQRPNRTRVPRKKGESSVLSEMEDELDEELDDISWFEGDEQEESDRQDSSWRRNSGTRVWMAKPQPAAMPPPPVLIPESTSPKPRLLTDINPYRSNAQMIPTARPPP